ncbi:MAG: ABC transporter substrate-binding protein [Anaerolineae bacterium]|nr:ABC transporter substrate-binding protein [Phycisphaerae bacterium]
MKLQILACFLIGLSVLFVGCNKEGGGSASSSSDRGGDIKIGHVASKTGDTATFGVSADEGIQLALDEINGKGGVLGRKVQLITEDDRSLADEAKTACSKLITRDKVHAILGEIASSRSIAIAPVCEDAKIPMLSPGSTNPKVTEGYQYVFRNCFIDPFQGTAMANFAMDAAPKGLGMKRFAVLFPVNSDYGVGLKDYFIAAVKKRGGEISEVAAYTEKSDVDFKGQLTKIKAANPEAIFVSGYYTEAGLIAKQARELGIKAPLLGGDGWDSDQTVKIGQEAIEGCYFSNHYSPDEDRPEVKKFVADYKTKFGGKTPDAMAILAYDAMKIMCDAMTRAGSTDGTKVAEALAATKDYPGASGVTTIDQDHNAKKSVVILKIQNGKFNYAGTVKPE